MSRLRHALAGACVALCLVGGAAAAGFSPLIVALLINGTPQGDMIIHQDAAGRYYLPRAEFAQFAQLPPDTPVVLIQGEAHVAADALAGTRLRFDPAELSLHLELPATAFAPQHFSLSRRQKRRAPLSRDSSLLLNYRADSFGGDLRQGWQLHSDQAWRWQGWLLSNALLAQDIDGQREYLRLLSHAQYDDVEAMRRLVLGDQRGRAGDALGSSQLIAGITLGRAFELTPDLIRFPTARIASSTVSPAEVELYVGDDRVFRGQVQAGPFELADFSHYGGLQTLRLVVRDASGATRIIEQPHYFASRGLAAGSSDFEWRLGLLRQNFGSRNADYGEWVGGGFYRYGLSHRTTVGGRLQFSAEAVNIGASLVYTSPHLGLLSLAAAGSQESQGLQGGALAAEYQLQAGRFAGLAFARWNEPGYRSFGELPGLRAIRRQHGASLSVGTAGLGSLSLSVTRREDTLGQSTDLQLSAGRGFRSGFAWEIAALRRSGDEPDREVLLNLRYRFGEHATLSSSYAGSAGNERQWQVQAFSDTPYGPGTAWRLASRQQQGADSDSGLLDLQLLHHADHLSLDAAWSESRAGQQRQEGWKLGAAGSLTWTEGRLGASRHVDDAFALVEISPPLDKVRVYHNNRLIGRTNPQGRLFVPALTALIDNAVSIEEGDIPFHYNIDAIELAVAPLPRSGSLLRFPLRVVRAVSGGLAHAADGRPLQHRQVSLASSTGPRQFTTGYGGRFYLEDLPPGDYPARLELDDMHCDFLLRVPADSEAFTELGTLRVCQEGEP